MFQLHQKECKPKTAGGVKPPPAQIERGMNMKNQLYPSAKIVTDIEEIAKIESMGTWEDDMQRIADGLIYDIWSHDDNLYAIAKHKDFFNE